MRSEELMESSLVHDLSQGITPLEKNFFFSTEKLTKTTNFIEFQAFRFSELDYVFFFFWWLVRWLVSEELEAHLESNIRHTFWLWMILVLVYD